MANLKYGSTGDEVKKLQQALGFTGSDVDGIFGQDTAAAVKKFQKNNGLAVDGIVGTQTQAALNTQKGNALVPGVVAGALTSAGATKPTSKLPANSNGSQALQIAATGGVTGAQIAAGEQPKQSPAEKPSTEKPTAGKTPTETPTTTGGNVVQQPSVTQPFTYDPFTYDPYAKSDIVLQAEALLQDHYNSKPGEYQSQWQSYINDYLNQIQNRDPFSYDFNSDALYNQYKDQYIQQGQMAMMDTMGQAAAMTGGYGNSYAQTVGQQAYNQQLNQLNNIMPELYQMAYGRYADEGQRLQDMYGMYVGLENQDYGRYQDNMNNWYADLDYLTGRADYLSETDRNDYYSEKDLAYEQYKAGQDLKWEQYLAEEEKRQAAADIMAGAGDYSLLGNYYGLTDDQVAQIKKANTPVASPVVDNGGDDTVYEKLTGEQQDYWEKKFLRAETVEDVDWIAEQMSDAGFEPAIVGKWYDRYASQFVNQQPEGLSSSRKTEIQNWLTRAFANAGPSIDANVLINASGYFKTEEEREYARQYIKTMSGGK